MVNMDRPVVCAIEACDEKAAARGYCRKHYMRLRRNGDPTEARRRGRAPDADLEVARALFPNADERALKQYVDDLRLLRERIARLDEDSAE